VIEGGLYLVATPIGNARDITLRALDVLREADILIAEDTRVLRKLMEIHGVALNGRRLWSYHDHSKPADAARIADLAGQGNAVAYCSDAGTPLVADPGFGLVLAARERNVPVTTVPGPSSVTTALALSGLATDRFLFAGFVPRSGQARTGFLAELQDVAATVVVFETAKRVQKLLDDLAESWGGTRRAALCRELTKKFEEVRTGPLSALADQNRDDPARGEIVLVVERGEKASLSEADVKRMLVDLMPDLSVRDAVDCVAKDADWPRKLVYRLALNLERDADETTSPDRT